MDKDTPDGRHLDRLREKIAAIRERRERLEGHEKAPAECGEDQISLTDPDARAMHAGSRAGVGQNVRIAVDRRHKPIAEPRVHNKVGDPGPLTETAGAAREALGIDKIDAVADRGTFKIEDIQARETAGTMPCDPGRRRGSAIAKGVFGKDKFRYDAKAVTCMCPGGEALRRAHGRPVRDKVRLSDHANATACKTGALKARCTDAEAREIARDESEAAWLKVLPRGPR